MMPEEGAINRSARSFRVVLAIGFLAGIWPAFTSAETVHVKYRGLVDLSSFDCAWIERSSLVKRLCYDAKERYVVVNLSGTYYHYCEVPRNVVVAWRTADSMGRFYNANMKGNFGCRVLHVPSYAK